MRPVEQPDGLAMAKAQRGNIARLLEGLKSELQSTHQLGDAECKLLDLEIAECPDGRRHDLLVQKRDAQHRLAASRMLILRCRVMEAEQNLQLVDAVLSQAGTLVHPAGGLMPV